MNYTLIARRDDAGKPIAGTFEVVRHDDQRIGTRGWWGGRSLMSQERAQREAEQRNAGQRQLPDSLRPMADAEPLA